MRLLSTKGDVPVLKTFVSEDIRPAYAILSHTWLADDEEVVFGDLSNLELAREKPGWSKVQNSRRLAKEHGYDWIWIDTTCINKDSSAELSEAINSMFQWYRDAAMCFVYLYDLSDEFGADANSMWCAGELGQAFEQCRWFSRGWTLQELLAPDRRSVLFYTSSWNVLGSLPAISSAVSHATGIDESLFQYEGSKDQLCPQGWVSDAKSLDGCCVAQRMSWAARRKTTRKEDQAYSLLGIFNVNMPIIYGEGSRAFVRLQKAIMAEYPYDLSLMLAMCPELGATASLYATSVYAYKDLGDVLLLTEQANTRHTVLTGAVRAELPLVTPSVGNTYRRYPLESGGSGPLVAILPCRRKEDDCTVSLGLRLRLVTHDPKEYELVGVQLIDSYYAWRDVPTAVTIRDTLSSAIRPSKKRWPSKLIVRVSPLSYGHISIAKAQPVDLWNDQQSYFRLPRYPLGQPINRKLWLNFALGAGKMEALVLYLRSYHLHGGACDYYLTIDFERSLHPSATAGMPPLELPGGVGSSMLLHAHESGTQCSIIRSIKSSANDYVLQASVSNGAMLEEYVLLLEVSHSWPQMVAHEAEAA